MSSSVLVVPDVTDLTGFWVNSDQGIRHFHISHNAPYLLPQILHNLCFAFLVGITADPTEIQNNAYPKIWGTNKVQYGKCGTGI